MSVCGSVSHCYTASLGWDSIQILFFPPWVSNTVGLFDMANVLLCPTWFIFLNRAVLNTKNTQFLLLALLMKQISKWAWVNSHMVLLFSCGVGVTQPKESDLGGESLAKREQIKLTAQCSFTRTVSKDVLELMMWEPAQCELLRLGIFQKLISVKICGVAAIFGHGQNVYICYTGTLATLRDSQTLIFLPFYKMTLG